jgi:LemA protein
MAKKEKSKMKLWITLGVLALIVLALVGWFIGSYNTLVTLDNTAIEKWANVESQYQRRFDLIPNLVSTVKGYAAHEEQLFTEITKLRSQWQSASTIDDKVTAANGLEGAIGRLMVVVENYPVLKASENFLSLQDELAGTENRISVERTRYNEAVKQYNIATKRIPTNIIASMFGFKEKKMFEAEAGSEKAPKVTF